MLAAITLLRDPLYTKHQALAFRPHTLHPAGLFFLSKLTNSSFSADDPVFLTIWHRPMRHLGIRCSHSGNIIVSGHLSSLFQGIGLGVEEAEVVLGKNPVVAISSFESIRTRVDLLQSIGLNGVALARLISKRPFLLTADEVDTLVRFLRDDLGNKLEPGQVELLLLRTRPGSLAGFDVKVRLLVELGIPEEKIVHVLNSVSITKAICLKPANEIRRVMAFLDRCGGAKRIILKRPATLNYDLDSQLIPRTGFLWSLSGGDEDAVGVIICRMPVILSYNVEHMEEHVRFLMSYAGLTEEEIFKIMLVFPNIVSASRDKKLRPRIDFLKQCGLDSKGIFCFLTKSPLFLGLSFKKNLSHKLALLVKVGFAYGTKDMAVAMGAVTRTSSDNLQKVIWLLMSHGFCCEDIVAMSRKHPQILQYKVTSIEEKIEYLIDEMGRDHIAVLLSFPAFLGYSLDKRIRHRYETRKISGQDDVSVNKLLAVSPERFSKAKKTVVQANTSIR